MTSTSSVPEKQLSASDGPPQGGAAPENERSEGSNVKEPRAVAEQSDRHTAMSPKRAGRQMDCDKALGC